MGYITPSVLGIPKGDMKSKVVAILLPSWERTCGPMGTTRPSAWGIHEVGTKPKMAT